MFHIFNHEGEENEALESGINTIQNHLHWNDQFLKSIIKELKEQERIFVKDDVIKLTETGRKYAIKSYEEIVSGLETD